MGLSASMGGICSPFFGWLGDHWGLSTTFLALAVTGLLPLVTAWLVNPRVNADSDNTRAYR